MPKRQYDDDEQISRASSKRAKTGVSDEEESEEEIPQTQTRPKRERKDKGRGGDSDEEDGQDGNEDEGEEDLDDFEKVHGEKLRAVLENRRRTQGVCDQYSHFFSCATTKLIVLDRVLPSMESSNISK
jgi:hypothetical protein